MIKLAIDVMGGDFAPAEMIKGAKMALEQYPDLCLRLFGDEGEIRKVLQESDRVKIVHAPKKLDMGEQDPISTIRKNKDLSMVMAFAAVRDKECDGVVTAGPTQGAIVASHLVIKRIKGMKRVALCPTLPHFSGRDRLLLDVGANTDVRPEHIVQHALFATVYAKETLNIKDPVVGLLNIGTEPGKGRELEIQTYEALSKEKGIHFYGNVEPKELLSCDCDIMVSDGFTGNMVMKAMEGTAKAMGQALKEEIGKTLSGKIGYLFMRKNLKKFKNRLNPDDIGGAMIFGVDGVVVKAHGSSNAYAFSRAIHQARLAVAGEVITKMKDKLVIDDEA